MAERLEWFKKFDPSGRHQLLVAVRGEQLLGYANSSKFREKAAYQPQWKRPSICILRRTPRVWVRACMRLCLSGWLSRMCTAHLPALLNPTKPQWRYTKNLVSVTSAHLPRLGASSGATGMCSGLKSLWASRLLLRVPCACTSNAQFYSAVVFGNRRQCDCRPGFQLDTQTLTLGNAHGFAHPFKARVKTAGGCPVQI